MLLLRMVPLRMVPPCQLLIIRIMMRIVVVVVRMIVVVNGDGYGKDAVE